MYEIKKFITQKEAIVRYGYSAAWFERERWMGTGPKYVKVRGKVLYPLTETDKWFESFGSINSTSMENNNV